MTQEEIVEMARESGMELYGLGRDRAKFVHYLTAFANLVAAKALAQPEQCKYPDCKCPTENPCLKGLAQEQEPSIQDRLNNALQSLDFYRRRIYALQEWHGKMRDPERTIVCDILVNGHTLDPAGDRYTHSPQPKQEPVAWLPTDRNPLTVEELKIIWQNLDPCDIVCRGVIRALVRAVESAHGIKENT